MSTCAYCTESTEMQRHCELAACNWMKCLTCRRLTVVKLQEI